MAEALGEFEQEARRVLQQRHLEFVVRDARVIATEAAQAVDELAGGLDAGKAAADDDEVAEPAADFGIVLEFDLRHAPQHQVANVHRVADRFQRHARALRGRE